MRTPAIVTVAAALSLLMMASATAQMRGFRDGPIPFGLFGPLGPRDEPRPEPMMRRPRDEPPAGPTMRGQRDPLPRAMRAPSQSPARIETPPPRIESAPAAQARTPPAINVALTQLNMNAVPRLTPDGMRKVQQLLKDKGLNPGSIDGVAGPQTNNAIREFQEGYGIKVRAEIDNQTLFALGAVDLAGNAN